MNNKPIHDEKFRKAWNVKRDRCQCCGIPRSRAPWPGGLQTHHIVRRSRSDQAENLLACCQTCHSLIHHERVSDGQGGYLPILTEGMQLAIKRLRDEAEYDYDRLCELKHERLAEPEPIPAWFLESWERWTNR